MVDQKWCAVLIIVQNPCEVEPPAPIRALKPHSPPHTPIQFFNQPHLPVKLALKPSNKPQSNRFHQVNHHPPLATPVAPHQIFATHEPRVPYSESRGELRRQFVVNQRPRHEYHIGSRESVEIDGFLGSYNQLSDANARVPGFRFHAEKLLQRVSVSPVQRIGRGSVTGPRRPKKVRFAPVVECFEF